MLFTDNFPFVIGVNLETFMANALLSCLKSTPWAPPVKSQIQGAITTGRSAQWRRCKVLTRDFLMKADCKTAFGAIEESLLWSAEQRAASLAATLACRPDDGPVWIFGYGSLMWNPALEFAESATGTACGLASRILPAPDRRTRQRCLSARTHACTERGRAHHGRGVSPAGCHARRGADAALEARDDHRLLYAELV